MSIPSKAVLLGDTAALLCTVGRTPRLLWRCPVLALEEPQLPSPVIGRLGSAPAPPPWFPSDEQSPPLCLLFLFDPEPVALIPKARKGPSWAPLPSGGPAGRPVIPRTTLPRFGPCPLA